MWHVGIRFVVVCFLCAVTTIAGVSTASAQQTHDYWFLAVSDDKMMIDYIDATSITPSNGNVRRAWTWTFHSTGADTDAGSHQVMLIEVNCRTRETRALQMTFYDSRGEVNTYRSENAPEQWNYVVPETFGEAEMQFICADPARRNYFGVSLRKGVTPKQHAQQFDAQRSFDMPTFGEIVDRVLQDNQTGAARPGVTPPPK